jgi:hypothetical protein
MSVYCRVCLTIKGKHISWFIVENKEEFLIYLRDLYSLYFTNIFLGRGGGCRVHLYLVFCVVFCRSLFVLLLIAAFCCLSFNLLSWYLQTLLTSI